MIAALLAGLGLPRLGGAETRSPGGSASDNLELLARVVTGEAQDEPYTGKVAVAAVILNRTHDSKFPGTVSGVIFQPGAFESVSNGLIWSRPVDPASRKAVQDALNGWDPTNGAVFFFNPDKTTNAYMWSLPQTLRIGKHVFSLGQR